MLVYVKFGNHRQGGDFKRFYCVQCGTFFTSSENAIQLNGAFNHSHVNPAGLRCNFMTFNQCENVVTHTERYEEHSWFLGYSWRFLFCGNCLCHIGWLYEQVTSNHPRPSFYGLLSNALHFVSNN
ncbi:MAG: hypothetical protein QG577_2877 [Thermodesulfobacteriota bacterium]|nr:hypothetical protein [Thermodesulfobacteriota bacterium]